MCADCALFGTKKCVRARGTGAPDDCIAAVCSGFTKGAHEEVAGAPDIPSGMGAEAKDRMQFSGISKEEFVDEELGIRN